MNHKLWSICFAMKITLILALMFETENLITSSICRFRGRKKRGFEWDC